jgi:FlaA1/EpsC-like NDP-sugar epimerase
MRHRVLLLLWLIADLAVFVGSYVLAYFLKVGWIFSTDFPFEPYLIVALLVSPLWLLVLLSTRTFALLRSQGTLWTAARIAYSCIVGTALFSLTYFFIFFLFFSRLLLFMALILSTIAVWLTHLIFEQILRRSLRRHPPTFPTLIVGVTRESAALVRRLNERRSPLAPVAILDGSGTKETSVDGVPVLGKLNKLEETLRNFGITHLIQCSDLEQSLNLLSACRSHGITYLLLPSVLGIVERDERVDSLEGLSVTIVQPQPRLLDRLFL